MPRIALLDPLTLVGRELTTEIQRRFPKADLGLFHTADDEEFQIASAAGQAALVAPLNESAGLSEFDVVVLAADRITPRLKALEQVLESNSEMVFIDASPLRHYRHITSPALDADVMAPGARLRPAHPSIVVASAIVSALGAFEPTAMTLSAVEPISIFGEEAVVTLAHQAAQRLQGDDVKEKIDGLVAAFNMTAYSGVDLTAEASEMLPGIEIVATRTLGGTFHGHLSLLSLTFASAISVNGAIKALKRASDLSITKVPLTLDGAAERDGIWLTKPEISPAGRVLALQAVVDGTRFGGAQTVASILQGLQ